MNATINELPEEVYMMRWIIRKWKGAKAVNQMTDDEVMEEYQKYRNGEL
jgi:hypothetical protein